MNTPLTFASFRDLLNTPDQKPPYPEAAKQLDRAALCAQLRGAAHLPVMDSSDIDCIVANGSGVVELAFRDYPSVEFNPEQIKAVAMLVRILASEHSKAAA